MRFTICALALVTAGVTMSCGGSTASEPAKAPERGEPTRERALEAEPTEGEASEEVPAVDMEADEAGAPASRASSVPAGAGLPGSMRSDDGNELDALWRDLDGALQLSTPDCPRGVMIRDRICELAVVICRLADEQPNAEIQSRCTDASQRCERARGRTAARCAR